MVELRQDAATPELSRLAQDRSSPERHSLQRFGRGALDVFAGRLALLHLGVAAISIPLAVSASPTASTGGLFPAAALVLLMIACAATARATFARHAPAAWGVALTALAALTAAALAATSRADLLDVGRSAELTSLLIAGVCGGLGLCRGLRPGTITAALILAAHLLVHPEASAPPLSFAFLGGVTYLVGGVLVRWAADRGFASTERALAGAEQAATERELATQRWRVGQREARQLHDTVLATLTLLAHGGAGVDAAGLRAYCARDVEVLAARTDRAPEGALLAPSTHGAGPDGGASPDNEPSGSSPRSSLTSAGHVLGGPGPDADTLGRVRPSDVRPSDVVVGRAVEALARDAHALRIQLQVHASPETLRVRVRQPVADALLDAATEALRNVRRHAGVDAVDLAVTAGDDRLSLVLSDEGVGFDADSAAVATAGSLGLTTARDRLVHVGGSLAVWSRPGTGTSVVISVPHTMATPTRPAP